jgi:folate-binding protein YgfZ
MDSDWQDFLMRSGARRAADGPGIADFGDPQAERLAAAQAAIVVDLSAAALLRIEGADAAAFLQGQVSCDLREVTPQASRYGGYHSPKGRVLALFLLWQQDGAYWMQLPAALAEAVRRRLSMFVLRSRVTLADASTEWIRIGVGGPRAPSCLAGALALDAGPAHAVQRAGGGVLLALPGGRHELVLPIGEAQPAWQRLAAHARPAGDALWEALAIAAGEPAVYPATQDRFVAQFLNLDLIGGVSFSKGCYTGQEIVARTHYLGRLKQRMLRARVTAGAAPQPGDELYGAEFGDQACGTVVRAAPALDGGYELLAAIRVESASGQAVHWRSPDGPVLDWLPLPYALERSG